MDVKKWLKTVVYKAAILGGEFTGEICSMPGRIIDNLIYLGLGIEYLENQYHYKQFNLTYLPQTEGYFTKWLRQIGHCLGAVVFGLIGGVIGLMSSWAVFFKCGQPSAISQELNRIETTYRPIAMVDKLKSPAKKSNSSRFFQNKNNTANPYTTISSKVYRQ